MKENILITLIGVMCGIGLLTIVWAFVETIKYLL